MRPEEITHKVTVSGKDYLIQLKNDKGQFISKKEAKEFLNTISLCDKVNNKTIDHLEHNYTLALEDLELLSSKLNSAEETIDKLKNIIYISIAAISIFVSAIFFFI